MTAARALARSDSILLHVRRRSNAGGQHLTTMDCAYRSCRWRGRRMRDFLRRGRRMSEPLTAKHAGRSVDAGTCGGIREQVLLSWTRHDLPPSTAIVSSWNKSCSIWFETQSSDHGAAQSEGTFASSLVGLPRPRVEIGVLITVWDR